MSTPIQEILSPFVYHHKDDKLIRNPKTGHVLVKYKNANVIKGKVNFKSKMINDINQDLCGGWDCIRDVTEFEETERVIRGLKPVGISSCTSEEETLQKVKEYRDKGFMVSYWKREVDGMNFITVSPKGLLNEVFDMKTLSDDYMNNELPHEAKKIIEYKNKDFSEFHNDKYNKNHPTSIVGLVLGYPIENTISLELYEESNLVQNENLSSIESHNNQYLYQYCQHVYDLIEKNEMAIRPDVDTVIENFNRLLKQIHGESKNESTVSEAEIQQEHDNSIKTIDVTVECLKKLPNINTIKQFLQKVIQLEFPVGDSITKQMLFLCMVKLPPNTYRDAIFMYTIPSIDGMNVSDVENVLSTLDYQSRFPFMSEVTLESISEVLKKIQRSD